MPFTDLRPGEVLEVHFVAAWAEETPEGSPSTWFAVDQDHRALVAALEGGEVRS